MGKTGKRATVVLLLVVFIWIIGQASYSGYVSFRDTVVEQQQEHLLTIARSVRDSIQRYVFIKTNDLEFLSSQKFDDDMMNQMVIRENFNFILYISVKFKFL